MENNEVDSVILDLLAKGFLEMGFDEKENDFTFWWTEKGLAEGGIDGIDDIIMGG